MKQKHTPESVLDILKEVKHLLDSGNYNSNYLVKKYPSFSGFRRVLIQKGIINSNRYGVKVWGSSVLPNIIMAREILKIHYNYCKDKNEVYNDRIKLLKPLDNTNPPKKTAMSLAKEIREDGESWNDAVTRASKIMREQKTKGIQLRTQTMQEIFPIAYAQDFESLTIKNKELLHKLDIQEHANNSYRNNAKEFYKEAKEHIEKLENTVKEQGNEIREKDNEIKKLQNQIENFTPKKNIKFDSAISTNTSTPTEPYFYRDLTPQEIMGTKPLTSKSSRTFKVFGIPIFTIDNK